MLYICNITTSKLNDEVFIKVKHSKLKIFGILLAIENIKYTFLSYTSNRQFIHRNMY